MSSRTKVHDKARLDDPQTSFDAAMHATEPAKMRASQARVLNMFKLYGEMTDAELLVYLNDAEKGAGLKPMSPSGARTRRSELSKPNMDRLDEIAGEYVALDGTYGRTFDRLPADVQRQVHQDLRREGFRAPLWDTGKRKTINGRSMIVWGLAV